MRSNAGVAAPFHARFERPTFVVSAGIGWDRPIDEPLPFSKTASRPAPDKWRAVEKDIEAA